MAVQFNLAESVCDYLDRNDWRYKYNEEKKHVRLGVNIKCKLKSVDMYITFKSRGFCVVAVCPLNADEDCRDEVMRYLTMANYGLTNGNFELDLRDGEVRYKTYTPCSSLRSLPDDFMEEALAIPPLMFDKYGNGLAALMMGFSDAKSEIQKAEND